MSRHLKNLARMAREYPFDPALDFWLLAGIVSGGRLLSVAPNEHTRSMFVDAYYQSYCNTHAELNAIRKVRRKIDLTGTKMYVVRIQRNRKSLALAKPCDSCQELMRAYGIKKVVYSIDDEEFGQLNLSHA